MARQRLSIWLSVSTLALFGLMSGCQRTDIHDDFRKPVEERRLVLPGASHILTLSGSRRVTVDVAVDYDAQDADDLVLFVQSGSRRIQMGRPVRGAGMKQAVCGVSVGPREQLEVVVQNRKLTRSVPFSIRVEPSPSPICSPYTEAPSMLFVRADRPGTIVR